MTREQAIEALKNGQSVNAMTYDLEEHAWYECDIVMVKALDPSRFPFRVKCADGVEWNAEERELLDPQQFKSFC